jgi:hypothetical protein
MYKIEKEISKALYSPKGQLFIRWGQELGLAILTPASRDWGLASGCANAPATTTTILCTEWIREGGYDEDGQCHPGFCLSCRDDQVVVQSYFCMGGKRPIQPANRPRLFDWLKRKGLTSLTGEEF